MFCTIQVQQEALELLRPQGQMPSSSDLAMKTRRIPEMSKKLVPKSVMGPEQQQRQPSR